MVGSQQQQQPPPPPPPSQGYYSQGQDQHGYEQYGQPPPYSYNPPKESDPNYTFDQAFKIEKPKYNDLWAGILMLLFFAGFVVVSALSIRGYITGPHDGGILGGKNDYGLNNNSIIGFALALALAFLLSSAYLALASCFPKQFIWVTGILNVALAIGVGIYYLTQGYLSGGIVFLLIGLFSAFAFWTWIPRIPFSALMLKTTVDVSKKHGHVYVVSVVGGIIALALSVWFSVTLTTIYVTYEPGSRNPHCSAGGCSKAKVIGLVVFVSFTMFWIMEWVKNTIHTIIAGLYGAWYFSPAGQFPKGATRGSAKRALTYSFGSISLGSLVIAIIQFLRRLCSVASSEARNQGGVVGLALSLLFCILGCLVSLLEWVVQFINKYAFCHIALYGKSYLHAAKDTWHMMKDRGIDALVNDCLIGPVLSFGALLIAFLAALFAYLYITLTEQSYNNEGQYTVVFVAATFLMAFEVGSIFTTPIASGVDTIFVAAGWDPQVMISNHPELYQEMVALYPKAEQAISVR
ncbi:putative choline transporter, neither null mutation nor overexpression affects choline transport [Claviceps citrina]|nr:putative choline transporter, neither null mutation nor overexpression affects choline transport [Claviceps citrina]